ncbi:hypothetical protein C8J57DRAFT_1047089 [Mycena rebaudengoi]|nr:hypothetical protein C8J57DRAFT_1047089 [Mycena rebaudengoi]
MHLFSKLGFALTLLVSAYAATPSIVQPAEGTHIAPGEAFNFTYASIADYGTSSYNYTVYLFTSAFFALAPSENFGTGHYFGRFAQPNYPGNPNPRNTPPSTLTMPDFSKNPGGVGSGAFATNASFYLVVLEEYATGAGSVGSRISLTSNRIVYNATGI